MYLVKQMKAFPWLFAGMAGLPFVLHSAALCMVAFTRNSQSGKASTADIPDYAYPVAFSCLPILSVIVGIFVASLLSLLLERWLLSETRRLRRVYAACFVVAWLIVYGYLGFFTFVMGLGALPAPSTMQQFVERVGIVLLQFPISIVVSSTVCAIATAIVMSICKYNDCDQP